MALLTQFIDYIRPIVPDVIDSLAERYVRQAVIEFCERTRLWRHEEVLDIYADDVELEIPLSSGTVIHEIENVFYDSVPLRPISLKELDRLEKRWRSEQNGGGVPKYFTQTTHGKLRVFPIMGTEVTIVMRLKPSQDSTYVPDFMFNDYHETICNGTLARLLFVPSTSYFSPDFGKFYAEKFEAKLRALMSLSARGQQNAAVRTRLRTF